MIAMAAISAANLLTQNQTLTLIHVDSPHFPAPVKPRFLFNFPISPLRAVQIRKRFTVSASAAQIASDFSVHARSPNVITKWGDFAGNVSGEWDGYGADFTVEGKPIELPEAVVPEAYREWEVRVFDWQTQCPTLAETEEPILRYKSIKLLPTVGCEADAATRYSIDERQIGGTENSVSAFAYSPNGIYVAVWQIGDQIEQENKAKLLELEHCLVDPRDRESRVRVIQLVQVERNGENQKIMFKLRNVKVFCEQWYGPFRNGEQLGGCSISGSGFATTDALKDSQVLGVWEGPNLIATFQSSQPKVLELAEVMPRKSMRDQRGLVLLPKQLWCTLKETEEGEIFGEAGWIVDHGHALTSRCIFLQDGTLKEIAVAHETISGEKQ